MMDEEFLACDWGGTNLRAWRIGKDNRVLAAQDFALGVSRLAPGEAETRFREQVRPALQAAFLTMASRRTGKLEARVRRILAPMRRKGKWAGLADRALCLALAGMLVMLCAVCRPVQAKVAATTGEVTKHNPEMRAEVERRLAAQAFGE